MDTQVNKTGPNDRGDINLKPTAETLKHILKFLLAIAILSAIFIYTGLEKSIAILLNTNLTLVAVAFITFSTSWIFRAARINTIFNEYNLKNVKTKDIYKINFAANALNIILPLKLGDIGQMYLFHTESKIPLKKSATSVIYTRLFDILTLSIIGLTSFILLLNTKTTQDLSKYIIILILPLLIIVLTSSTVQAKLAQYTEKKRPRLSKIISAFTLSRKCRITSIIYSILTWTAEGATTYIILKGLGQDIPIPLVFLGLALANMIKSIPTTPGGIGLFEGSMALIFISFGINQNIAIVAATLDHLVKNINTLLFGIPSLMSYKYDISTLKKMSRNIKKMIYSSEKTSQPRIPLAANLVTLDPKE